MQKHGYVALSKGYTLTGVNMECKECKGYGFTVVNEKETKTCNECFSLVIKRKLK